MVAERHRLILGHAQLRSQLMSNQWQLAQDGTELAIMRRFPRGHMTSVKLADDTILTLAPFGWGTVRAMTTDGVELGRIMRRSWLGRLWELQTPGFHVELVSRPTPRRWSMTVGGEPIAELAGSLLSYNRVDVEASINVPVVAVLLAWQVIARPWEGAAYPIALVPGRAEPRPVEIRRPETA